MLAEEDTIRLYHHVDNSKVYHEKEAPFIEIEQEDAPAVEELIKNYPKYSVVSELHDNPERAVTLIQDLYDLGLLLKKKKYKWITL